jgi:hypothetical protein
LPNSITTETVKAMPKQDSPVATEKQLAEALVRTIDVKKAVKRQSFFERPVGSSIRLMIPKNLAALENFKGRLGNMTGAPRVTRAAKALRLADRHFGFKVIGSTQHTSEAYRGDAVLLREFLHRTNRHIRRKGKGKFVKKIKKVRQCRSEASAKGVPGEPAGDGEPSEPSVKGGPSAGVKVKVDPSVKGEPSAGVKVKVEPSAGLREPMVFPPGMISVARPLRACAPMPVVIVGNVPLYDAKVPAKVVVKTEPAGEAAVMPDRVGEAEVMPEHDDFARPSDAESSDSDSYSNSEDYDSEDDEHNDSEDDESVHDEESKFPIVRALLKNALPLGQKNDPPIEFQRVRVWASSVKKLTAGKKDETPDDAKEDGIASVVGPTVVCADSSSGSYSSYSSGSSDDEDADLEDAKLAAGRHERSLKASDLKPEEVKIGSDSDSDTTLVMPGPLAPEVSDRKMGHVQPPEPAPVVSDTKLAMLKKALVLARTVPPSRKTEHIEVDILTAHANDEDDAATGANDGELPDAAKKAGIPSRPIGSYRIL